MPLTGPTCGYCGDTAILVDAGQIYGTAFEGKFNVWQSQCGASVGCKPGPTPAPAGTLANPELRELRKRLYSRITAAITALGDHPRKNKAEREALKAERDRIGWLNEPDCRRALMAIEESAIAKGWWSDASV